MALVALLGLVGPANSVFAAGPSGPTGVDATRAAGALSVSVTHDAFDPIEIGRQFKYTINYSCAGSDCVNPALQLDLSPELVIIAVEGNGQFPNGSALYYNQLTKAIFRSPTASIPAGSTGQLTVTAFLRYGDTCNGTETTATAVMTADGSQTAEAQASTVTARSYFKYTAELIREAGDALGGEVVYRIRMLSPQGNYIGGLNLYNPMITFTPPTGAEFVDASDGGQWNPDDGTATWQLPNIVSTVAAYFDRFVTVRYPAAVFSNAGSVTAEMHIEGSGPSNCAESFVIDDSEETILVAPYDETEFRVYGPGQEWIDYVGIWGDPGTQNSTLHFTNSGNVPLDDLTLTHRVPVEREVLVILTGKFANAVGVNATISYQKNDNPVWIPIGIFDAAVHEEIPLYPSLDPRLANTGFTYGVDQITALRWEYGTVPVGFHYATVNPNSVDKPGVFVKIPPVTRDGRVVQVGDQYYACATAEYSYSGSHESGEHCITETLRADSPVVVGSIQPLSGMSFRPGETSNWRLTFGNYAPGSAFNPRAIINLPPEFEFVSFGDIPEGWIDATDPQNPDVPTISAPVIEGPQLYNELFQLTINLRARAGAPIGTVALCWGGVSDTPGWNSNPVQCQNPRITGLASVESTKQVQGASNYPDYASGSQSAKTVQGGAANYRLTIQNTGNVPLEGITVVDLLPRSGDVSVLAPFGPRGSGWTPQLAGPIVAPADVTVTYSTTDNPCRSDIGISGPTGCVDPAWTAEPPSPITSVRALRFEFGSTLNALEERVFDWPMVAPLGAPHDSQACNSYAYSARRADDGAVLLPSEPAAVCVGIDPIEPAALGDFVWEDTNFNGLQDDSEEGVNGIAVTLLRPVAGGAPVVAVNRSGIPMQTVTADNASGKPGFYLFSNLEPGDYIVTAELPEGKAFARNDGGNEALDSDIDPATGQSAVISLGPIELYSVDIGVRPPNSPPIAVAGEDAIHECLAPTGTDVILNGSSSSDPDGDALTYTWLNSDAQIIAGPGSDPVSTVTLPLGEHLITLYVADDKGAVSTDVIEVTVEDTTPPEIIFAAGALSLWPPNHKYRTIDLAGLATATDACDAAITIEGLAVTRVTSDEPEDVIGNGDGKTTDDMVVGATCQSIDVRAERQGGGNGRVYSALVTLADAAGNAGSGVLTIGVPHDVKDVAADDGPAYSVETSCLIMGKDIAEAADLAPIPTEYELGNYPNPFNPSTTIRFALPEAQVVRLEVIDMAGRRIAMLVDGLREAGTHEVQFGGQNLSSGLYVYRMQTDAHVLTGHMLLLK
ncbi:MAG: SdrD B-like domain-containing protein [Rhodothermales bacterium]